MRYIITQGQFHNVVYKFLDNVFGDAKFDKEFNYYNSDSYRVDLKDKKGRGTISYFYYAPEEYDDDDVTKHNGISSLHVHPDIVDTLRSNVSVRESKVLDLISDWFSEKYNVDVDEISIYPERKKPAVY